MLAMRKFILPSLVAATVTSVTAISAWAHDSVVKVSLWDKGADAVMATGLGMGMEDADMSKATMGLKLSTTTVDSGNVTFQVTNNSKVNEHEMIVAPVTADNDPLAYDDSEDRVDEEDIGDLGEVSELEPGGTGSLTLRLKPGKYVLFCNVPGHYMDGMWTMLTVN